MTAEQFAHVAAGIQSALTAVALLLGGAWALYTFRALGQLARSRAEIQKLEVERRRTEAELRRLEQESNFQAVLHITLAVQPSSPPIEAGRPLPIYATIENKGNRNAFLNLDGEGLEIYSVTIGDSDPGHYSLVVRCSPVSARDPNIPMAELSIRAGGQEVIPFLWLAPLAGAHLLVFKANTTAEEHAIDQALGFTGQGQWTAKLFIFVA